jgi:tetratricopeptide (TPR) repeat protein
MKSVNHIPSIDSVDKVYEPVDPLHTAKLCVKSLLPYMKPAQAYGNRNVQGILKRCGSLCEKSQEVLSKILEELPSSILGKSKSQEALLVSIEQVISTQKKIVKQLGSLVGQSLAEAGRQLRKDLTTHIIVYELSIFLKANILIAIDKLEDAMVEFQWLSKPEEIKFLSPRVSIKSFKYPHLCNQDIWSEVLNKANLALEKVDLESIITDAKIFAYFKSLDKDNTGKKEFLSGISETINYLERYFEIVRTRFSNKELSKEEAKTAIEEYIKLVHQAVGNNNVFLKVGWELARLNPKAAQGILFLASDNPDAKFLKCFTAYKLGKFDQVMEVFNTIVDFEPDTDVGHMFKAICLYKKGEDDWEEKGDSGKLIVKALDELNQISPNYQMISREVALADSAFLSGLKCLAQDKYQECLENFAQAIEEVSKHPEDSMLISEDSRAMYAILGQAIDWHDYKLIAKIFEVYSDLDMITSKFGLPSIIEYATETDDKDVAKPLLKEFAKRIQERKYPVEILTKSTEESPSLFVKLIDSTSLDRVEAIVELSKQGYSLIFNNCEHITPHIKEAIGHLACAVDRETLQKPLTELGFPEDELSNALDTFYPPDTEYTY